MMEYQRLEVVFCCFLMTEVFVYCLGIGRFTITGIIKLTLSSEVESAYKKNCMIIIGIVRFALD